MTTIVGDWTNKLLVADSQFTDTDSGIKYFEEKVFAIDGGWVGVAGNYVDAEKVLDYLSKKTKTKPKLKSDSSFLKLTKDEHIWFERQFGVRRSELTFAPTQEEIDILIVVEMFLTGFDSDLCNTLYYDRGGKYHTLIQAFNRTTK